MKDKNSETKKQILSAPSSEFGERFPVVISKRFTSDGSPALYSSLPMADCLIIHNLGLIIHQLELGPVSLEIGLLTPELASIGDWNEAEPLSAHFLNNSGKPRPLVFNEGNALKLYDLLLPIYTKGKCFCIMLLLPALATVTFSFYLVASEVRKDLTKHFNPTPFTES